MSECELKTHMLYKNTNS